jgi:hypothetical protein
MGFQETHLDFLQNIEFAVVSVYRDHSTLLDYSVMNALDALIEIYRAESRGHTPREISLEGEEKEVLDRVKQMCEWRMGRDSLLEALMPAAVEATTLDDMLSCLRKIRRSLDKWNSRGGSQGYLRFVSQYVG